MHHTNRATAFVLALLIIPFATAVAQDAAAGLKAFPDFMSVRSEFLSLAITADPTRALAFQTAYRESPSGRVRVSVVQDSAAFHVQFQLQRDGDYPLATRGNIIVDRQYKTGYITRIAWCLNDDGQSWILLTPNNERTIVDYIIAGTVVRGNYRVSSLIYVFLTNPFTYLYDATRAGIDWSPVIGGSGTSGSPAVSASLSADMAGHLLAGRLDAAALALLHGAVDFSRIGEYLGIIGADASVQPVEEVAPKGTQMLSLEGGMPAKLVPARTYRPDRGLPVESVAAVLAGGAATGSVYIGILEGVAGSLPQKLVFVPYFDASGGYRIAVVDATTRQSVELTATLAQRAGGYMRLFRLPAPFARQ